MNGISQQRQHCLEAWINCENLLACLASTGEGHSEQLLKTVDECAHICMETWQALQHRNKDGRKMVLLCIGICEECADLCNQFDEEVIRQCARSCRRCADSFTRLALSAENN